MKELGKITAIKIGRGGYQDCMFGVSISLGGEAWECADFKGTWDLDISSSGASWTEDERNLSFAETTRWLSDLMRTAKVEDASKLKGVPIEATFEGNKLASWRILTEVI